jgi:hypothetical protein
MSEESFATMEEAGELLGVDPAAARRLLNAAGLARRIGKRILVVDVPVLEKFARERRERFGVSEDEKIRPGRPKKKPVEASV